MTQQPEVARPMNPFQLFPSGVKDYFSKLVPANTIMPVKVWDFTGQINRSILFIHFLNCVTTGQASKRAGLQLNLFSIDNAGVITDVGGNTNASIVSSGSPVVSYNISGSTITVQADASIATGSAVETTFDIETLVKNLQLPPPPPPPV